jgi:hypothetical protein
MRRLMHWIKRRKERETGFVSPLCMALVHDLKHQRQRYVGNFMLFVLLLCSEKIKDGPVSLPAHDSSIPSE